MSKNNQIKPNHYHIGKYECIEEMVELFGIEAVKSFCRLNCYKYRYRATMKGKETDIEKVNEYMDILKRLNGEEVKEVKEDKEDKDLWVVW